MFPELNKSYEPQAIEPGWAQAWVEAGLFRANAEATAGHPDPRPAWSLVIPPPNVTGSLHMGHMLEHTLIDIMVRWQRMRGKNVLWLPGTDHAGIATQMVVERALAAEGKSRQEMGRDAFVAAVWEWKKQSGDRIKEQMMRLGTSCDWSRERFTLDEGLSRAVREVFVTLHEEGLIYRGRYIVNWCPRCQTAVSDLEVNHEAVTGKLYHVRYAVVGRPGEFLVVATTRPETILGDVAVAVNPADPRYQKLIGAQLEVPLAGRTVPVIADEIAQADFGSGAVKITPGHDANDFAAGQRHGLEQLVVMDERGQMNAAAGDYAGMDRFAARKRIVAELEEQGLLVKVDDHAMALGLCQRCRTVIEPRISPQWFVKIAPLAEAAVAAVEEGHIQFVPENNAKIYFEWMNNIRDWCISRQLWWGHRVPAWHCAGCKEITVARETPAVCPHCGGELTQSTDVLDTWFSSGLWPFSTLGWPDETADLATFYPTSLLITGFDILFFWVARMIMLGVHFMGKRRAGMAAAVPFREVYIHALVRDADKQKMSKTKGNVIDPLLVTDKYGTDAVRFTLAAMAAPGTDIALSEERMAGYAAFANKIWNASRFIFMSLDRLETEGRWNRGMRPPQPLTEVRPVGSHDVDLWIFGAINRVAAGLQASLEAYRFHDVADQLYHFFWTDFCDWYLEFTKVRLNDAGAVQEAADNLLTALEAVLRLLHPVMPFITEQVWRAVYLDQPPCASIALAAFPVATEVAGGAAAARRLGLVMEVVKAIRSVRSEKHVRPKETVLVQIQPRTDTDEWVNEEIHAKIEIVRLMGRCEIEFVPIAEVDPRVFIGDDFALNVVVAQEPSGPEYWAALQKKIDFLRVGEANLRGQLENQNFMSRAPEKLKQETKRKYDEVTHQLWDLELLLGVSEEQKE